ncbi:MAG: malate dehydrogenase [Alphaproteobacteria bacterium]|nr:MAG: malate dehydrogenase [Alphaproteobacteria bacterium]
MDLKTKALNYHAQHPAGKIGTATTKPVALNDDLSLAYTPGVAAPCLEIARDPENAYKYTNKGHLVAVISNGTAVLGLGNIGALASKPVMEGKSVLLKRFSGLDSFDIEVDCQNVDKLVEIIAAISPSFGAINLEDIKAPECFEVEKRLINQLNMPVFHDDQHGTAVVTLAGLKSALELQNKKFHEVKIVMVGAGSAGIAIANFLLKFGVKKSQIYMFDSQGLLHKGRGDLNTYKQDFAEHTSDISLEDAMKGCDVFLGISVKDILSREMVQTMSRNAIIFAMTNPDPEIKPEIVWDVRPDILMATGRGDYPNQINNVLCFPYLFRGTLDVGARKITDAMKIACVNALSDLAKLEVPRGTLEKYNLTELSYGKDYFIPKALDERLLTFVTPRIADAAIQSGVAQRAMPENYEDVLSG